MLCRKRISISNFTVSSLACKWVFYRPDHNAKGGDPVELTFDDFVMQK